MSVKVHAVLPPAPHKIVHFAPFRFLLLAPPPPAPPPLSTPANPPLPPIASPSAISNTSSTPLPCIALTSAYLAPIRSATACPSAVVTGWRPWALSISKARLSVRRSVFVATRMRGVDSQKWETSGYHCVARRNGSVLRRSRVGERERKKGKWERTLSSTFSKLTGKSTAKQMKRTSVSG